MATVTVHDAKTNLSKLIARALDGEDVVIANRNIPKVRLVPVEGAATLKARVPGSMAGQFPVTGSFFDPLPEDELRLWEGHED